MASGVDQIAALGLALGLAACSSGHETPRRLTDAQILNALNQRAGAHACCFYMGRTADGRPLYGQLRGARQLRYVVRSQAGDESIACGWSGFAAPRDAKGQILSAGPDRIFIIRNDKVYFQEDMASETFDQWQTDLCGPAWVKPRPDPAG